MALATAGAAAGVAGGPRLTAATAILGHFADARDLDREAVPA